ncbi:MAG: hypothetical protein ACNA7U_02945 [Candidatus Izemoplasmataceae bacterium]|jgi:hypothetical protein|uniref:hypothetical protein n=1 Tax=Liberiplasma polymorphum TaxID=3374570 RepID=UPI0037736302
MNSSKLETLFKTFKWHEILRSIVFSLIVSFIIILPFLLFTINILLLYIRFVYPVLLLLSMIISVYFSLVTYITLKTLSNYNELVYINTLDITFKYGVPTSVFIFALNAIFIIIFTPYFI